MHSACNTFTKIEFIRALHSTSNPAILHAICFSSFLRKSICFLSKIALCFLGWGFSLSYYPDLYVESWFNHTKIHITVIVSTVKNLKAGTSPFSPFSFNHYLLATCCVSKQSKGPSLDTFHNPIWNPEAKSKAACQIAKPKSLYSSRAERNPDNKQKPTDDSICDCRERFSYPISRRSINSTCHLNSGWNCFWLYKIYTP